MLRSLPSRSPHLPSLPLRRGLPPPSRSLHLPSLHSSRIRRVDLALDLFYKCCHSLCYCFHPLQAMSGLSGWVFNASILWLYNDVFCDMVGHCCRLRLCLSRQQLPLLWKLPLLRLVRSRPVTFSEAVGCCQVHNALPWR